MTETQLFIRLSKKSCAGVQKMPEGGKKTKQVFLEPVVISSYTVYLSAYFELQLNKVHSNYFPV